VTNPYLADRLPEPLPTDPMHWADAWLREASAQENRRNPNSVTLVTVGQDTKPSARVVLCKSFQSDAGYVVVYTNYLSRKCQDIEGNANVSLLFHWDCMGRQVRIGGTAVRSPAAESDAYFASRDPGSQLGAWGSDQSQSIASREALVQQIRQRAQEHGVSLSDTTGTMVADESVEISRPPHWGGLRVWASTIELWVEGKDRIHDRGLWTRTITPEPGGQFQTTAWTGTRLQP
jgi:pyridoxamine 5'-phosphate oxidase